MKNREIWFNYMKNLSYPILNKLYTGDCENIKIQGYNTKNFSLEGFCRTFVGISYWMNTNQINLDEKKLSDEYIKYINQILILFFERKKYIIHYNDPQLIVEFAILCLSFFRSENTIWCKLNHNLKNKILDSIEIVSKYKNTSINNWLLFESIIHLFLLNNGRKYDENKIVNNLNIVNSWYLGEGFYLDGKKFSMDYYNSFVIHPFLIEIILKLPSELTKKLKMKYLTVLERSQEYSKFLMEITHKNGDFPRLGRSITYRFGAFHIISLLVYLNKINFDNLNDINIKLTNVLRRFELKSITNKLGLLEIGFKNNEKYLGETYINTGSLYFCMNFFLALGLDEKNKFWN